MSMSLSTAGECLARCFKRIFASLVKPIACKLIACHQLHFCYLLKICLAHKEESKFNSWIQLSCSSAKWRDRRRFTSRRGGRRSRLTTCLPRVRCSSGCHYNVAERRRQGHSRRDSGDTWRREADELYQSTNHKADARRSRSDLQLSSRQRRRSSTSDNRRPTQRAL